jgi:ectoine hydroxylase-related dioxygenase (phytanoyl-CoA dioxygenase family)
MTAVFRSIEQELDSPYSLQKKQIDFYQENGYIKLRHVLTPDLLKYFQVEITKKVRELNTQHLPMGQRSTYAKAFLQVMNLWTESRLVRRFVFSKRLAKIASELMDSRGVRIYHDQALYKESGGGITPWHADQYYWPVSSDKTVTVWIPLQATPLEMGPLAFCEKSHRLNYGRDLEISDESELKLQEALRELCVNETSFEMGEVSFHAGWTFHRAGPNTTPRARKVMTIIYMDQDIRVIEPKNTHQMQDLTEHMPGISVGQIMDSPLNPVLYTRP